MKAFIVDDEFLQRNMVKKAIAWDEIGIEIMGEAEDGEEALMKILEGRPDIVIMDINIPYMNGIEVSRKVKENLPDIQIIILTAYGEFEYAKQALQLGVVSFVLKPVNPEELCREVLKCKEKLKVLWENRNSMKRMREEITQKQKEKFLLERMSGIVQSERDENVREFFNAEQGTKMALLFLKPEEEDCAKALAEDVEEMVEDYFPRYEMLEINGSYVYLLLAQENMEYQLSMLCAYLQEVMNKDRRLGGGTSLVHQSVSELREAYEEAYSSFRQGRKQRKIHTYNPIHLQSFLRSVSYEAEIFFEKLRKREYAEFLKNVDKCFRDMDEKNAPRQAVLYVSADILIRFSLHMTEQGIDFEGQMETDEDLLFKYQQNGEISEVADILYKILKSGLALLKKQKVSSTRKKAEDARIYINENYNCPDLSLNLVADAIGVNASYLSNIFKKEFNYSLSRYIMASRLKAAKKIMTENPKKTLIEISEMIGYSDVYYFSKNFKNYYGITPSVYMEEQKMQR